jgi:3-deoxy-D-manno-octulosonic-acid transferase
MHFFYSIFIQLYGFAVHLAAIFNLKARDWILGRENWQEKLTKKINITEKYCWIHCASAGEFEQAIPIIKELRFKIPDLRFAVSFFSPSGYEMYHNSNLADVFFYFPLDTKNNATQLIEILKPEFVIFIRNEIWLNTLTVLQQKSIPTFLLNANIEQRRNFVYRKYLDIAYALFTKVFDTTTFGNTKLERVIGNKEKSLSNAIIEDFCKDSFVIILGSSWQTEEKYIVDFYKKNYGKIKPFKLIIAPHEPHEKIFKKIKSSMYFSEQSKYTKYKINQESNILYLDQKGILKYAYRYADIAFIGGGFGKGVHNISEAAVYGIPTIFGSNYHQFEEVNELVDLHVAFHVKDYENFEKKMVELINNTALRKSIKVKLTEYFIQQKNAFSNIVQDIVTFLKNQDIEKWLE